MFVIEYIINFRLLNVLEILYLAAAKVPGRGGGLPYKSDGGDRSTF